MERKGWSGGLYLFCGWVTRCIYLNVLWILFTFAGLLLFGFAPSTVALFSVAKRWVSGEEGIEVFKLFTTTYKESFVRANLLGMTLYAMGLFLYVDLQYFLSVNTFLYFGFLGLLLIYTVILLYIFPVFVSFKMSFLQYVKHALILAIYAPVRTFGLLSGSGLLLYVCMRYQGLFFLFSGSALSLFLMRGTLAGIGNIEQLNQFQFYYNHENEKTLNEK